MFDKLYFAGLASVVVGVMAAAPANGVPIYSQDFDGTAFDSTTDAQRKTTLEAEGWDFDQNDADGEFFDTVSGDRYLGIGGDSEPQDAQASYSLTELSDGTVNFTVGTVNAAQDTHFRFLDGGTNGTELFQTRLIDRDRISIIDGSGTDAYQDGSDGESFDLRAERSSDYPNRLSVSLSWTVNSDGTGSTFSYDLDQEQLASGTGLDTGNVTGGSFLADGIPDTLFIETDNNDSNARTGLLFDIDVSGTSVPEPSSLALLGLGALVAGWPQRTRANRT